MSLERFKTPIGKLLIAYVLLASIYSIITPLFEASDELWHYPTVKYIADHGLQLPVQDPNVQTAWRQEGSQPPLYYIISAMLTMWIDTSDFETVRRLNPHADIGILVPDGNVNMAVHDPAVESFPWRRTVLAVHIVRFFSVLLGAVTVAMTYILTRELFPEQHWLALAAVAFTAFNPMFLFISGSVNNDNLSNALGSILLVLIVRLMKRTDAPSIHELVIIGVAMGVGLLVKLNVAIMIPFIALSLALMAYRLRDWRPLVIGGLVTGGLTILIAGWWYLRNWQLYGDPTGLNVFLQIVGRRPVPPNWAQLWSERHTFMMSYWGFFGGVNVPMPDWVYTVFNLIVLISVIGLIVGLVVWLRRRNTINWMLLLGRTFTLIWVVVLFVGLIRWTSETWASQGRLMFAAIAPLSMWMAVGLATWHPVHKSLVRISVVWFVVAGLIIGTLINFVTYNPTVDLRFWGLAKDVIPSYQDVQYPLSFREPNQTEPTMRAGLNSGDVQTVKPGEYYKGLLSFYTQGKFFRDWSAFIHLENEDGLIVAQRDVYLKRGLVPTTLLAADDKWNNEFAVRIPDHAYAPETLNVYLGFYDPRTNERLIPSLDREDKNGWQIGDDNRVLIGTVHLVPHPSTLNVPNPIHINFSNEAELVGYNVSTLVMFPGEKVTVTLYWQALRKMTINYRTFVQVLELGTTNVFGASDGQPVQWTRPTSTWQVGEIIKDEHTFVIHQDAPPGTWQIQAGIYNEQDGKRLLLLTREGGEADNVVLLTRIKMTLAPEPF